MRVLLLALAVLGVVLGCSLALAADGGAPTPPAIDAGADEAPLDAGPYRTPPPPAGGTSSKAESVDADLDTEIGIIKRAYLAIRNGEHVAREIAALMLILVGLLFQRWENSEKYSDRLPSLFKGKRGRFILVTVLAAMGALGHQALASSFGDWDVWKAALAVLIEASFGYVGVKSLLNRPKAKTA